ncbi:MAG: LysR substrate-binding domain-containing protein [Pseudomonadota bacterium]
MEIKDLDLNLLIVFDAVYSVRNISKAAENLDVSQSTVSHALGRLRKQLDDPLFVRSGNGVSPTVRASAISGPIKSAIENLRQGLTEPTSFDPSQSDRRFKIMMADPMEPVILPSLISKIQDVGNVTIELVNLASATIEQALLDGAVEAVVFLQPTREEELIWEPLCPVDLVLIARAGHPVADETDDPGFMQRYGHVSLNLRPGVLPNSNKVQLNQRVVRRDVCVVNRMNSIPNIVANSDLLAIVPAPYARKIAKPFNLQIIRPPVKLGDQQMFLIWHKRSENDTAHQWLREQIHAAVKEETAAAD